jgi:REP element-mobilizing transposase RayT
MKTRKGPAHFPPVEQPDRPTVLMVTTCVKSRRHLLACAESHDLLRSVWRSADHWQVNRYVIMPDHIHFFCCPANRETPFKIWQQFWRAHVTRQWPRLDEKPIWQKDDWDTQIRFHDAFTEKWHYVRHNPVRQGLVKIADEWPYQGEVFPFVWLER